MPHFSIDKLQKFFKLESERGFDNRAVVGGLDKILTTWEAEARVDNLREDWIQEVITRLKEYPLVEPVKREQILRSLWKLLQITREDNPLSARSQESPSQVSQTNKPDSRLYRNSSPAPDKVQPPRKEAPTVKSSPETIIHPPAKNQRTADRFPPLTATGLNAPLTVIPGIGVKYASTLGHLGLHSLGDLLYYFPRRFDDFSQLKPINRLNYGDEVTVIANIESIATHPLRGGQSQITEAVVSDGTGYLRLTWFNQPWQANHIRKGSPVTISGKIDQYLGRLVINNPEVEPIEQEQLHTNRFVPVYPLTAKITQRWLRRLMYQSVTYWAPRVVDFLPEYNRIAASLVDLPTALLQSHFPDNQTKLTAARQRLAFDEIFLLQLGVMRQKQTWQSLTAQTYAVPDDWLEAQIKHLPFKLTNAQRKSLADVRADLVSGRPMNRLLQGDVGSGKTVIAALAAAMATCHGVQTAIMAPTGILAEQHYRSMLLMLGISNENQNGVLHPEEISLLLGDTPENEKKVTYERIASGEIKLVISTHAVIESSVIFNNLQLVIVDEQHRFGVSQRAALRMKGSNPHLLVMTATPIPRSLALTVYGDLDLTVLDEMPAGRQAVETHILSPRERERAYSLIKSQVEKGFQAFIIYPLIEQSEGSDEGQAAVTEYARLQRLIFPKLKLGLLHGRLKQEEKDSIMMAFRQGEYHILISTSVVEVGVDIPNATVMLVEGANRFGLAQLHQFRGRVGRGTVKSFCLLIPEKEDALENERLAAMAETNDGFVLAERDLQQRGPGDFLGTRQAGYSDLKMASLTDVRLIEKARNQAQLVFAKDPELSSSEHALLKQMLNRFWHEGQGDIS